MKYTEKLGLKLPELSDLFNVEDFNDNMKTLDNFEVTVDTELSETSANAIANKAVTPAILKNVKDILALWEVSKGVTWDLTTQEETGTNESPDNAEWVSLIETFGKTTQNTTEGTNYIPPVYSQGRYGLTVTYDPETNMIIFGGTANQTVAAYDIYAVGNKNSGWTVDDPHITIPKGSVVKTFGQNIVATQYVDGEFTTTATLSTFNSWLAKGDVVLYRFTNRIPITKDTTPEPLQAAFTGDVYEPYTGGIPSPSPDYPQEIKSVESFTVKVTNDTGDIIASRTITPPRPLNAIGDVKDICDVAKGVWEYNIVSREVPEMTVMRDTKYAYASVRGVIYNDANNSGCLSDMFSGASWSSVSSASGTDNTITAYKNTAWDIGRIAIHCGDTYSTLEDINAVIRDKKPKIIYPSDPTTEPINPEDLAFLRSLANTPSDSHITVTDNNGNDLKWLAEYIIKLPGGGGGGGSAEFTSLSLIFKGHFAGTPDEGIQPLTVDSINSTYAELVDGGKFKAKKAGVYVVKLTLAEIGGTSSSGTDVSVMLNDIILSKKQLYTRDVPLTTRETHALAPGDLFYVSRGYSGWVSVQNLEIYILK